MSSNGTNVSFKITDTKLYFPIVTFSTKDNVRLTKQLSDGFKRSAYWNEYQSISATEVEAEADNKASERKLLDACFLEVKRLFVLAYDDSNDAAQIDTHKSYFLPTVNIVN